MKRQHRPALEPLEDRIVLDNCTVTRLGDVGAGATMGTNSRGDLRFCINHTNANPGQDLIMFRVTGTINLQTALPSISDDLIILGPGADQLTVRRAGVSFGIFDILADANVEIYGLTIAAGRVASLISAGGITNHGVLTLHASRVVGNVNSGRGGGIYNRGVMTITDTTIAENLNENLSSTCRAFGGGIFNHPQGTLTIANSTISENSVRVAADCASSFSGLASGGGIANDGVLTLIQSTVYGNTAHFIAPPNETSCRASGGGIASPSNETSNPQMTIRHSTITANEVTASAQCSLASSGGGIYAEFFNMDNTIVSGNIHNDVTGSPIGANNLIGGNAMLGPLADNGGPTQTVALLPGSPAIDAGDNTDAPAFDQRGPGFPRIINGIIDIGAYEVQATGMPSRSPYLVLLVTADWDNE
jgi:hypothetical protein